MVAFSSEWAAAASIKAAASEVKTALAELPTITPIETMAGDRRNHGKVFIGVHGRGFYEGQ